MKKLVIACVLISQSFMVYANQPLSKALITSFYATSEKLEQLESKHPKIFKHVDSLNISDESKVISYLKSSKAYPDINAALSSNGFKSLNEFFEVSKRFMGGMYSVQLKKMPQGMDFKSMEVALEENIKSMKQNGAPKEMLVGMEDQLKEMRNHRIEMQLAVKSASKADIKFVNDNLEWLMSVIPDDEVQSGDEASMVP